MNFLKRIISPVQNCEEIAIEFCKQLKVRATETSIKEDILQHPDYPSLLTLSDVLKNMKTDNMSLKTTVENLVNLPLPFVAQVYGKNTRNSLFAIIDKIDSENVEWYNPEGHKTENISFEDFAKQFTGYVLIAEADETSEEQNYRLKLNGERRIGFWNSVIALLFPILFIIISCKSFLTLGFSVSLAPVIYLLLTLVGCAVGILLLLYEIDQHNPTLQEVCHAGRKTNCAAILNSDASRIFGISWSCLGFTYFAGTFLALMFGGVINDKFLFIAAWINTLVLPYVFYSIYYQGRIAKEWCPMCLLVQLVLVLQFVTALFGGFHGTIPSVGNIDSGVILIFALCFMVVFVVVQLLIPSLKNSKEGKQSKMELQRLKHNSQIFDALLLKQKQIDHSLDGLGVTLGNPDAQIHIVKVCNPYCGPCAKAHPIIDDLVTNNPNIRVQVIFTATPQKEDIRNLPVKHFLTFDRNNNKSMLEKSLNDWYLAEIKDYDTFKHKYPIDDHLDFTTEIQAMSEWCNNVGISFTPTFFVNGNQLPDIYHVSDLKYFLSV